MTGDAENDDNESMNSWLWWMKQSALTLLSLLFLILGIETLVAAYRLNNPLLFIMAFFSASLIILVSAVGILCPLSRFYSLLRTRKP